MLPFLSDVSFVSSSLYLPIDECLPAPKKLDITSCGFVIKVGKIPCENVNVFSCLSTNDGSYLITCHDSAHFQRPLLGVPKKDEILRNFTSLKLNNCLCFCLYLYIYIAILMSYFAFFLPSNVVFIVSFAFFLLGYKLEKRTQKNKNERNTHTLGAILCTLSQMSHNYNCLK